MDKKKLYEMQLRDLFGDGNMGAFVGKDFICWRCKKDVLLDEQTLKNTEKGIQITGCPFCNRSFCD